MIATIITIARRWWPWIAVVALVTAVGWLIRDYDYSTGWPLVYGEESEGEATSHLDELPTG